MGELLKKIQLTKEEIDKLTKISNEKAFVFCELAITIADSKEMVKTLSLNKENLEENIMDFKLKKGMLFTSPVGIILSLLYFSYLIITCFNNLNLGTILFTIIGAPACSLALSFMFSSFLANSKNFSNFLMKKFDSFKNMNKELNALIIEIETIEKSISNIINRKDELINEISTAEDIIENKRKELHELEEEYFKNISTRPITASTSYVVSAPGKKRIRTIEDRQ